MGEALEHHRGADHAGECQHALLDQPVDGGLAGLGRVALLGRHQRHGVAAELPLVEGEEHLEPVGDLVADDLVGATAGDDQTNLDGAAGLRLVGGVGSGATARRQPGGTQCGQQL
jgi:hypothetical protein